jgi:chromate transporter
MVYLQLFWSFLKIGFFSFGGGYAMLPLIQQEIITGRGWLTSDVFLDIIAVSEITPGPVAINSATFVGYKVAGVMGSALATLGVVLPSFLIVTLLAFLMKKFGQITGVQRVIGGLRPIIVALIASATLSLGRSALVDFRSWLIAISTFLTIRFTKLHPILVILLAALAGVVLFSF